MGQIKRDQGPVQRDYDIPERHLGAQPAGITKNAREESAQSDRQILGLELQTNSRTR